MNTLEMILTIRKAKETMLKLGELAMSQQAPSHTRRHQQLYVIQKSTVTQRELKKLLPFLAAEPELSSHVKHLIQVLKGTADLLLKRTAHNLNRNPVAASLVRTPPVLQRKARPTASRSPRSNTATADNSSSITGRPDDPDPDPAPERPYLALGIDHKATTPAGPPAPVSLRLFPYRIEMRCCHDGHRTHSQNADPAPS